jgi:hypothetical protein
MIRATRTLILIGAIAIVFLGFSTAAKAVTCLPPGVQPGDLWGPNPGDVYPDVPACPTERPNPPHPVSPPISAPMRAPIVTGVTPVTPVNQPTASVSTDLPSTDTDMTGPAVNVITIWIVAIIVILAVWHRMAWHDDE